jgi:hypothetical protein
MTSVAGRFASRCADRCPDGGHARHRRRVWWSLLLAVATLAPSAVAPGAQQAEARTKATARQASSKQARANTPSAKNAKAKKASTKKTPPAKRSAAKPAVAKPSAATAARPLPPGWPVKGPAPLPGSLLPYHRIVAYYGNPLSTRMGVLGEYRPTEMLRRLDREVRAWERADTLHPVKPALHLIAVVAQGSAGKDGKWRARMADSLIERVYGWARAKEALLFVDVQVGKSTLRDELPELEKFLSSPDVHLGIDPEFSMKGRHAPGKRVGTYDARDVNWAIDYLAELVDKHKLPPKVLVIHRFTRPMLTNADDIKLDPRVQVVIHMDGWGSPSHKKASYDQYVASEPVQFTGFKLFYKNDVRGKGWRLMRPRDVLALYPRPLYIQYQ